MTVLQSAAGVFAGGVLDAVTGLAAVPLAAAVLGCAGHTPTTVITAASSGTAADVSTGAGAGCGGAGAPGRACSPARVPNRTHISQLLRISHFLQDWSFRKLKILSHQILAQAAFFSACRERVSSRFA